MFRINSMKHTTVKQEITWNFDTMELTHSVTYSNNFLHTYQKLNFPDFQTACIAYESLENLAKQFEKDLIITGKATA